MIYHRGVLSLAHPGYNPQRVCQSINKMVSSNTLQKGKTLASLKNLSHLTDKPTGLVVSSQWSSTASI